MKKKIFSDTMNYLNITFKLILNAKFKYLYGGIRRRFLFYFARSYFDYQMSKRKGECSLRGDCCKIVMTWCQYFENGRCSIHDRQPFFCKVFPIDERDKELGGVKKFCSYYFD